MKRPPIRPAAAPGVLRFSCPCGAALKVPASAAGGHGRCPKCRRRLQLGAKPGITRVRPRDLGSEDPSGKTFLLEESFRIEDHFTEIPAAPPARIGFACPCGRRLATSASNADKRARCPHCGARLLLTAKTNPRTGKLEFHPLALEVPASGDTMLLDA